MMNEQTQTYLFFGLALAIGLYAYSRTNSGKVTTTDVVGNIVDNVDIAASRITGLTMSRGYANNNPGNIRYIAYNPWNGQIGQDDRGFGIYDTMEHGVRAMGHQLMTYANRGLNTVSDIISTWAPSSENNTSAYIKDVADQLNMDPNAPFDVQSNLANLAQAIARHENGYVDSSVNWTWVYDT